jgi:hypothetical protein
MGLFFDLYGKPVSTADQVMRGAKSAALPMPQPAAPSFAPPADDIGAPGQTVIPKSLALPFLGGDDQNSSEVPTPASPLSAPVLPVPAARPPVPSQQRPVSSTSQDDGRAMLRETAQALILKGSPSQKVMGMQMMFEANQPTEQEKASRERERMSAAVDSASADDELKARAKTMVELGAKPEQLMVTLGFDEKGRKFDQDQRERMSRMLTGYANDTNELAQMNKTAALATDYLDKGTATTGLTGYLASYIPASDARNLSHALDTLKAAAGFDRLQQMREESKTGGALGQVTEQEMRFLQASQGSLNIEQDPAVIKQNIGDIIKGKQVISQMRLLVPGLEKGDAGSIQKYMALTQQLAEIGTEVQHRAGQQDVKGQRHGAAYEQKYGGM